MATVKVAKGRGQRAKSITPARRPVRDNVLTLDVSQHLSHLFKRLFPKSDQLQAIESKLNQLLQGQEKIMTEIDDLNQKVDDLTSAVGNFTPVLNNGVTAIQTEIQQLAAAVQSATDLATLKTQVTAAAGRLSPLTDAINAAGATLQSQVDALNADDPPAAASSSRKK